MFSKMELWFFKNIVGDDGIEIWDNKKIKIEIEFYVLKIKTKNCFM